ncbi:hypothetical protein [Polaromonas sp.]|uniref:hypothetical protein n=1 Tax=Polaromonas sp. TaxID=1869339 RepID=UPI0032648B8D
MATTDTPVKLGPFNQGVNNRLPDNELQGGDGGAFLRSAVNVDLRTTGTLKRRQGVTLALAGLDCHSLHVDGDSAYMVDGTTLYSLTGKPAALTKAALRSGLVPGGRISYTEVNGDVVYTDGVVLRRLSSGQDKPFGVAMMDPAPGVAAAGAGNLAPGLYQVCFTYIADDLQQSGSTEPVQVEVTEGQAIEVTGLPATFPAGVVAIGVYMSPVNGDQLMLATVLAAAQTSFTITAPQQLTSRCQTLMLKPMPAGSIVRSNNGRLLVARDRILHYSEPFAPSLHLPAKNFIPFTTRITVVQPIRTGTYVCTENKSYFFAGDLAKADAVEVLPYGAIEGTGNTAPDNLMCWWMSVRGQVQANGADVKNVQEGSIAMNSAAAGASFFREQDGMKHVVTSLFGSGANGAAAHSFMDGEIVRKATQL